MWRVQVLGLLFLSVTATFGQGKKECCPSGTYWLKNAECSNKTDALISCKEEIILLNPYENINEKFSFINGGNDLLILNTSKVVPPDRYCLLSSGDDVAALVCNRTVIVPEQTIWPSITSGILSIISAIFMLITFAVYAILPELWDLQGKALLSAVASLASVYIVYAILQIASHNTHNFCIATAFALYYCFMATFLWLNVVGFNVWRTVWFKNFPVTDSTLFVIYSIIGWGGAVCFLIAILTGHYAEGSHVKPGFGCWFKGPAETWSYFYGPVTFLLTLNLIYFCLAYWKLWHRYSEYSGSTLQALRFKCLLYSKMFLLMSIIWIFEVIFYATGAKNLKYWILRDILNILQGVIIFLLLVATRKQVKRLLAEKRPCGIKFPRSWLVGEDEESEAVHAEEEGLSRVAA